MFRDSACFKTSLEYLYLQRKRLRPVTQAKRNSPAPQTPHSTYSLPPTLLQPFSPSQSNRYQPPHPSILPQPKTTLTIQPPPHQPPSTPPLISARPVLPLTFRLPFTSPIPTIALLGREERERGRGRERERRGRGGRRRKERGRRRRERKRRRRRSSSSRSRRTEAPGRGEKR